jgi:Tol biopolymer transport system component
VAYTQQRGEDRHIYARNVETSEEHAVTVGTGIVDWDPCWSPSGQSLAFTRWQNGDWNLWRVDLDGRGLAPLTDGKGTEWDPTWGAGGNIYFSFLQKGQDWDIWRLELNPPK